MNILLLALCGALIACTYALGKVIGGLGVGAVQMLFWQITGGGLLLLAVSARANQLPLLTSTHLRYYVLSGLLGFTGPYLLTYWVLNHLPSGLVGVVASLSPLMTYAIVSTLPGHRSHAWKWFGLALGLSGVLAILLPQNSLPSPDMLSWAFLACFSPLLLAAGNVYRSFAWPIGGRPLQMGAGLLLSQWLLVLPLFLWTHGSPLPIQAVPAMLGLALSSGLYYLVGFELQRRTTPVFVGQLGYVIALFSLLIGILFFQEQPSVWVWLGTALIVCGVLVVSGKTPQKVELAK